MKVLYFSPFFMNGPTGPKPWKGDVFYINTHLGAILKLLTLTKIFQLLTTWVPTPIAIGEGIIYVITRLRNIGIQLKFSGKPTYLALTTQLKNDLLGGSLILIFLGLIHTTRKWSPFRHAKFVEIFPLAFRRPQLFYSNEISYIGN